MVGGGGRILYTASRVKWDLILYYLASLLTVTARMFNILHTRAVLFTGKKNLREAMQLFWNFIISSIGSSYIIFATHVLDVSFNS